MEYYLNGDTFRPKFLFFDNFKKPYRNFEFELDFEAEFKFYSQNLNLHNHCNTIFLLLLFSSWVGNIIEPRIFLN